MTALENAVEPPTPAQLDVLRLIDAGRERNGFAPTIREICDLRGCSSTNSTAGLVNELKRKGFVDGAQGKARTLKVTKHGQRWLLKGAA